MIVYVLEQWELCESWVVGLFTSDAGAEDRAAEMGLPEHLYTVTRYQLNPCDAAVR